ncbi:PfkB family carbohydrate kinase, partial [Acidobacteria bacterium AH-259-A15]|nr:PfkB family carbohydrate kinase [Acidobacteria bacterium AH-259-A15]
FPQVRVAVVGDFFLDRYLIIDPKLAETSIETGLRAYQVVEKRASPGAGGTVASNLSSLGIGTIYAVGFIGLDGEGFDLKRGLRERRVSLDYLIEAPSRFTPTYTKPMEIQADGSECEMNRQDIKNRTPTSPELEAAIIENLRAVVPEVDGIIVLDQVTELNCGVVTEVVCSELAVLAQTYPEKVLLGDSRAHVGQFRNLIIKANQFEAVGAIHPDYEGNTPADLARRCAEQLARHNAKPLFLTLGTDGIGLYDGSAWSHLPTIQIEDPIDIVGAGDSATAGIVSSLCSGASLRDAAIIGNIVASITVQQVGVTGTASSAQVWERFEDFLALGIV